MRTLWQIPYSPWSTKARWALNHHRLDYRSRDYRIALDELPLRVRLAELERGLDGERHLVGGRLSFADLAMASAVDFVVPLPLRGRGPAIEACWGSDELAARFRDLVDWRDELVGTLRPALLW